ncbi:MULTISPECIES: TetR/AcrR family transcriptional regulator [unclassified Nocardioides]|uniref:TetR/AcrR family transcriptional regulator n=1 Tax=unclassified Nocardioides TaxID=2615069 RepID=UPI000702D7CF|nr:MULTISPECIES: TetR/AcrR family transcriptional regulator [unclassified Nocardioides]KRC51425.1 TetR family transcriptional regulator [Nocardioides sp. Root79]KRC69035.1 TetR family transcriptional regulator [Nocardioides sp. Root240]
MTATTRTRLSPDERRTQLLELGFRLLATRSLDELSIDLLAEEAGISRGLLYHYFGTKLGFFEAVVQHAADDLYARTAPAPDGEPLERLLHSITGYVDYVIANQAGYRSLVKAASGSNDALRAIYETTFTALADRFFTADTGTLDLPDTPAVRLVIHAWQAMVEDLVLTWCETPAGLTRDDLIHVITGALPALIDHLP